MIAKDAHTQIMTTRIFRGDKWTKLCGSRVPVGTEVRVIKFYPRRRAMIEYEREPILTMLWCLKKVEAAARGKPRGLVFI